MGKPKTTLLYVSGGVRITSTEDGRSVLLDDIGRCYIVYHGGVSGFTTEISKSDGWQSTLNYVRRLVRNKSWPVGDRPMQPIEKEASLEDVFDNLRAGKYGNWAYSKLLSHHHCPTEGVVTGFASSLLDSYEKRSLKVQDAVAFFRDTDPSHLQAYGFLGDCAGYYPRLNIVVVDTRHQCDG